MATGSVRPVGSPIAFEQEVDAVQADLSGLLDDGPRELLAFVPLLGDRADDTLGEVVDPLLDLELVFVEVEREVRHDHKLPTGNGDVYSSVTSVVVAQAPSATGPIGRGGLPSSVLSTPVPHDDDSPGPGSPDRPAPPRRGSGGNGDEQNFEAFFAAHHDAVLRSVTTSLGDRDIALDATQDAFIKAHARWASLRRYDAPDAWVRRIAINVGRDRMRSDRRRRDREASIAPNASPDAIDAFAADVGASELLAGLADRQREVATLFYLEDRSVDDIADRLGLNAGTVKFHLARARERLRDANPG